MKVMGIRDQTSMSKLLISDWSTQRMLNSPLCTRVLPRTIGDVFWRPLKMPSPTQTKLKWPTRKVKGTTAHLPFHSDGFCLPGPKVQFTSRQQGPAQSLSLPTTAHWVSSNFYDEHWRACPTRSIRLWSITENFCFFLWIKSKKFSWQLT